jgi:hypothetical protein
MDACARKIVAAKIRKNLFLWVSFFNYLNNYARADAVAEFRRAGVTPI